jgi:hypothetical protein
MDWPARVDGGGEWIDSDRRHPGELSRDGRRGDLERRLLVDQSFVSRLSV